MTANFRNLVVGIGSAHGDDQAGWRMIDILSARNITSAQLRKAAVPHDLIDWIGDCQSLHLVDACDSETSLQRCQISAGSVNTLTRTRSRSSHQFGIANVIELAASLGMLPDHVVLWAIPARHFGPNRDISESCLRQVEDCANRIQADLMHSQHAASIP